MKAIAVKPAQRALTLVEHPVPVLRSPTDVKLRMLEVGVCGTDKEICTFEYGRPPADADYLVLGHGRDAGAPPVSVRQQKVSAWPTTLR